MGCRKTHGGETPTYKCLTKLGSPDTMYPDVVRYIYFILTFIGCNPEKGYSISQILLFSLIVFINLYSQMTVIAYYFVREGPTDIADLLDTLSGLFFLSEAGGKMLSIFCLKRQINILFQQMQTEFWEPRKYEENNDDSRALVLNKIIEMKAIVYLVAVFSAMSMLLYIPVFGEGEKLIYEAYRPPGCSYFLILSLQAIAGLTHIIFGIFPFDIMFMTLLSCTTMQFNVLNQELQCLFDVSLRSKEEVIIFRTRFKRCIDHYDFLLRYTKTIDQKFSIPLAVSFVTMFSCHTMEMYRLAEANSFALMLRSVLFVTAGICPVFLMCFCVPAQQLTDEAYLVRQAVYSNRWYNEPKQAKPLINIIARTNMLVKIVPCGILELNLEKGLAAIRAMVSYAMFLKTVGGYNHK